MRVKFRPIMVAVVVALPGCSVKEAPKEAATDSSTATQTTTPATAPKVVNITATEYKFDAPESIPAGLTTFRLTDSGKEMHHATLIKLDSGKTLADFQAGMKMMKPGTPPPSWVVPAGGPNAVAPGSTSEITVSLEPGNYALVCFIPDGKGVPHVAHGMMKGLTVTAGAAPSVAEPAADVSVTLKDYQFDFSTPLTAGKHTLKIETAPGQPHEFTLFQLAPGKTTADLMKYVETGMKGPPPAMPLGGVAGVSAGRASYYTVDLKPGEYAIVCFLEDSKDGKPHFMHGMVQQIKIS
ncbi:MAG TPA: hypothetical protein VHM24_08325 [Gemmatimonadaceae bacterium]|nr:hypothetical protein [Gemmatimonadaceae bacterium]